MAQPNNTDKLKKEYFLPKRIMLEENTTNSAALFEPRPRQCGWPKDEDCFILKAGGTVCLDFGKELQGGLSLSIHTGSDATLHVIYGESVSEAMSELGDKNSANNHSLRDYYTAVSLMTTFETGNTGFRFVRLTTDKDIYFYTIQAFSVMQDLEYKGSFECEDELLNTIWKTGAYTVNLNMQSYIWDGIKRDRLVWIGDMHPEVNTILSVFGAAQCINNSLDFAANDLKNKKWMNNIPTYSMWWLIIQYDLYMYSGNKSYLQSHRDTVFKIINALLKDLSSDNNSFYYFVDWSSNNTPYQKSGFYAVLLLALKTAVSLCKILDVSQLGDLCIKKIEELKTQEFEYSGNKQMTALKYLSGTLSDTEAFEILTKNGAENLSCFMGFYVLMSLAEMKKTDELLDIIRDYWGGQIKMGATTFWEDFDINWMKNATPIDEFVTDGKTDIHGDNGKFCYTGFRHSLCHGWASGPTAILSKYILGVYITKPGCKQIKIAPQLGSLKCVKGSYPTPYGVIKLEHQNIDGVIKTKISAPDEIEILCDYDIIRTEL